MSLRAFLCGTSLLWLAFTGFGATPSPSLWPEPSREHKPWTRWWWPASAVDPANLTWQLEQFAAAGLGGVEITPIYGARGAEARYLEFLSPRWIEMLAHTGQEARRLGLGVDMATGTGWPFGGPWVTSDDASAKIVLKHGQLTGEPTGMRVKRAAPGGEGFVLDPFSPEALRRYLTRFDETLGQLPPGLVRGQFHDSFEYYGAGWTKDFSTAFQAMHGYDLQEFASELLGDKSLETETLRRIKSDYRESLAHLHLTYLNTWVQWAHRRGFIARNQSHGAPGNLLDLYANADIPETELFGSTPFPIPGLRRIDDEVRHDQDLPESLVIRMASSAAHVAGRRLASSESCTWLRDHWKVALSYTKPELDRVLLDGINHIVYHGTVFSPPDVPWPGWLFYASTQFNPSNPWWDDFAALNAYVERVQSILQHGEPDNEILLYWPIFDVLDDPKGMVKQLGVHDVKWLINEPVGKLARTLLSRGYTFDYISDAQLAQTRVDAGALITPGARYKVLIVPAARRMPARTLQQIAHLVESGATVIFETWPEDVPGYGRLSDRQAEFQAARARLEEFRLREPRVALGNVEEALARTTVAREPIADAGIGFIRRRNEAGHDYFFANLTATPIDRWVSLGVDAQSAMLLDPLTGRGGVAALRKSATEKAEIYLQLAPGESRVLRTSSEKAATDVRWSYFQSTGDSTILTGTWQITFLRGGPVLPAPIETRELKSWTELGDAEAQRFAGTARYRIEFERPVTSADAWSLDLGDPRESARVRLNGQEITTAWSVPFVVTLNEELRPGRNVLELDVTNLAANRIRDLDRRGIDWKIMREINFVNINYRPFDASNWAIKPSGLLGPVRLTPLQKILLSAP